MIESFEKKHIEECSKIFYDIYINKPFDYGWLDYGCVLRYFCDIFKTPKFRGFILSENNIVIGVCIGVVSDYFKVKKYHISEFFVRRRFSNKGFGTRLIKKTEEILEKEEIKVIELNTDKRRMAFEFYTKNGYYPLDENVNMIKPINR